METTAAGKFDRSVIDAVARLRDVQDYSFIVEYVPPIIRPPVNANKVLQRPPVELYVHIPSCPYICDFCSFYKVRKMSEPMTNRYLAAVRKELDLYLEKTDLKQRKIGSLFFGGGTPTTLLPAQFSQIINYLRAQLNFPPGMEITTESTPDTLTNEILVELKKSGVNRVSIGVQDFHDEVLAARRRGHTGQEAINAFNRARHHGFDNINIDLIYRLPLQTLEKWQRNLEIISELQPDSVTLYHLRKERRTPVGRIDESNFPSKKEAMEMYLRGLESLTMGGYTQIAPDQFTKPDKLFVQQEHKWRFLHELLGLGVSAYSRFNDYSYRNIGRFGGPGNVEDYIKAIEAGSLAIESGEKLTAIEKMCQFAVLGIKTSGINRKDGGIDKKLFSELFGVPIEIVFGDVISELKQDCLILDDDNFIKLTLGGLIIAEEVATRFYSPEVQSRLQKAGNKFGRDGL